MTRGDHRNNALEGSSEYIRTSSSEALEPLGRVLHLEARAEDLRIRFTRSFAFRRTFSCKRANS